LAVEGILNEELFCWIFSWALSCKNPTASM